MEKNEPFIASEAMQLSYAERDANCYQWKNCKEKNKHYHWLQDSIQSFTTEVTLLKMFGYFEETVLVYNSELLLRENSGGIQSGVTATRETPLWKSLRYLSENLN